MVVVIIAGSGLLIGIAAFALLWPLIQERRGVPDVAIVGDAALTDDPLVDLVAQRDSVYQALRELRFDHQVGKVSDADYKVFDAQLKSQAVAVLKQIDTLKKAEADSDLDAHIEAEIAVLRHGRQALPEEMVLQSDPTAPVNFCPKCGLKVQSKDRFCGKCGATLSLAAS
jgi:hypothetical protein